MTGMARATGIEGLAALPPMIQVAIGARKNMWTRYMPKVSRARRETNLSFPAAGPGSAAGGSAATTPVPPAAAPKAAQAAPESAAEGSAATLVLPIPMQLNIRNSPKVCNSTLGVQKGHDHSISVVGITTPGVPFNQNDQAVKAPPTMKHKVPTVKRFRRSQPR